MHLSCLRPGSCFSPSWIPSGFTVGSGCSGWGLDGCTIPCLLIWQATVFIHASNWEVSTMGRAAGGLKPWEGGRATRIPISSWCFLTGSQSRERSTTRAFSPASARGTDSALTLQLGRNKKHLCCHLGNWLSSFLLCSLQISATKQGSVCEILPLP